MVAKARNQLSRSAVEEEIINSIAIVVTRKNASVELAVIKHQYCQCFIYLGRNFLIFPPVYQMKKAQRTRLFLLRLLRREGSNF
jgi:hypothetical protein